MIHQSLLNYIKKYIMNKKMIVFSPHYDDAVYSLGMLLSKYKENCIVINVFTEINKIKPYSPLILEYVKEDMGRVNSKDLDELVLSWHQIRQHENIMAANFLEVKQIDLNYKDAIFRTINNNYIYFKEDLIFSEPKEDINYYLEKIQNLVHQFREEYCNCEFLFPMAFGNHIDHIILNRVGKELSNRQSEKDIMFYYDFPYAFQNSKEYKIKKIYFYSIKDFFKKYRAICCYQSQIKCNFGNRLKIFIKLVNMFFIFENNNFQEIIWTLKKEGE